MYNFFLCSLASRSTSCPILPCPHLSYCTAVRFIAWHTSLLFPIQLHHSHINLTTVEHDVWEISITLMINMGMSVSHQKKAYISSFILHFKITDTHCILQSFLLCVCVYICVCLLWRVGDGGSVPWLRVPYGGVVGVRAVLQQVSNAHLWWAPPSPYLPSFLSLLPSPSSSSLTLSSSLSISPQYISSSRGLRQFRMEEVPIPPGQVLVKDAPREEVLR